MRTRFVVTLTVLMFLLGTQSVRAEVDREKLLKDPGVYATFAVFKNW